MTLGALVGAAFSPKRDSAPAAMRAKTAIRQHVLENIGAERAHVFDGFAGAGLMFDAVWHAAASYVGCDLRFYRDNRLAFVCDNRRVMRNIDLAPFTIFDFDSYGSPWDQVVIVAARRKLAAGERIGFVLTDGVCMKLKFGSVPIALTQLSGVRAGPGLAREQDRITSRAIHRVAVLMGATVERRWEAVGRTRTPMRYIGIVMAANTGGPPLDPVSGPA